MRHLRRRVIFIAAIFAAISLSFSFRKATPLLWRFTGNECDWTQRINPSYYVADWSPCYPGENHFCKLIAVNSGGKPVIPYPSTLYNSLVNDQDILPQPVAGLIYLKD